MASRNYRIVIKGRLSERLGSAFRDVTLEREAGRMILRGENGQARLDGVLARLNDLGIEPMRVEAND